MHTADEDGIFGSALDGGDIASVLLFVEEDDTLGCFEGPLACGEVYGLSAGSEKGEGVSDEDGHADAEGGEVDVFVENFFCLKVHFFFFFSFPIIEKFVDMGNDIEGDLFGVVLRGSFFVGVDFFCLLKEFVHGGSSCAGDGLVCRGDDAMDGVDAVEGC